MFLMCVKIVKKIMNPKFILICSNMFVVLCDRPSHTLCLIHMLVDVQASRLN